MSLVPCVSEELCRLVASNYFYPTMDQITDLVGSGTIFFIVDLLIESYMKYLPIASFYWVMLL